MKEEVLRDYLEERADQLLDATLDWSEADVDRIYGAARPDQDPSERAFELAERAAALCDAEQRPWPVQLQAALAETAQLKLPLDHKPSPAQPRVLLIDHDADRLMARRKLFSDRNIDTDVTTSASDGLARLEMGVFKLVIMDYVATTKEEQSALLSIQNFNLRIPVINVCAWVSVLRADNRLLNRDLLRAASRLCRRIIPDRLRNRPPKRADSAAQEFPLFDAG